MFQALDNKDCKGSPYLNNIYLEDLNFSSLEHVVLYFTFCDSASMLLGRWSRLLVAMCAVAVASGLRSRRFFISSVLLSINSGVAAPCSDSDNCIACKIDVVKRLRVMLQNCTMSC